MSLSKVIFHASNQIAFANKLDNHTAQFEAKLLLQYALNVNRAWLIVHESDCLKAEELKQFETLLNRRLNGEPIAYILGYREFYGLHLKVTPDTLIPRPDTETLVEAALNKIPACKIPSRTFQANASHKISILDLGTGSGAIALAIAKNHPLADVIAVDASQSALNIAIENAKNLTIYNAKFILSDWFSVLNGSKFDLIVSNPPYIEIEDAHLKQGDLRFEPQSALASGSDGLNDIRQIIFNAPRHLHNGGWLMLEHGYNQAPAVAVLFKEAGFVEISHVLDLSKIERVTIGQLRSLTRETPI